jgi:hypothetical protein
VKSSVWNSHFGKVNKMENIIIQGISSHAIFFGNFQINIPLFVVIFKTRQTSAELSVLTLYTETAVYLPQFP